MKTAVSASRKALLATFKVFNFWKSEIPCHWREIAATYELST
jgi:hypothetical protein